MIPSAKEVEHPRELLSRYFRPTRLVAAGSLAQRSDGHVYLKIESDLPTGSFKPRGALNACSPPRRSARYPELLPPPLVIHGAAVAYAARIAKIGATIFSSAKSESGKSKLTNTTIEKKFSVVGTTRNWRTVNTLLEMARSSS